jgi:cytochrome c oxidase assembly factor CtaG
VTLESSPSYPTDATRTFRTSLAVLGFVLWSAWYLPPLEGWARRFEYVQAMQFAAFSILIPVLLVSGAPWKWLGLSSGDTPQVDDDGRIEGTHDVRIVDRQVFVRARKTSNVRATWLAGSFIALTIFWRVAPVVDYTVRHPWVVAVESLSLIGLGIALWLDLVESPPLSPGTSRPYRLGIAAVVMWTVWVLAYLDAMSHNSWYTAFHHVAGHGISEAADQQFTAAFMWFLSATAFLPVIFWNLVHWLQSEENPTDELNRMIRRERTLGP